MRTSFLDTVSLIDYQFSTDRRAGRRAARAALRHAAPEDRIVAEFMARVFTEHPYDIALLRLREAWKWRSPQFRERLNAFTPTSDPHLYRTTVRTDEVPLDDTDQTAVDAGQPWNPQQLLPGVTTLEQRERFNSMLARMIDLLSEYPFQKARAKIAELGRYCHPDDRELFDACVPRTDPRLYTDPDPDLHNDDTIARGIDATEWRVNPVRDRYRPSRVTAPVTAHMDAARNDPDRYAERRAKAAAPRPTRVVRETPDVADYFANRVFVDSTAEKSKKYDFLAYRARIYRDEPRRIDRTRRRLHRGPHVLDAEVTRAHWDVFYVGFVAAQFDLEAIRSGRRPISDEQSMRQAQQRTRIRVHDDVREPYQSNGNDLDYDQAATPAQTGWPCVSCLLERPVYMTRAAMHHIDGMWRTDDGLCAACRADGRAGIPAMPEGSTNRDLVMARCDYLLARYPGSADHILDRVIRAARRHPAVPIIREAMSPDFGRHTGIVDLDAPEPAPTRTRRRGPVLGAGQRYARCCACFEFKAIHDDDLCTTCRVDLRLITVAPPRASAAA